MSRWYLEHHRATESSFVRAPGRWRTWVIASCLVNLVVGIGALLCSEWSDGWLGTVATTVVGLYVGLAASRTLGRALSYRTGYLDRAKRDLMDLELVDGDPAALREFRMRQQRHDAEVLLGE